MPVTNETLIEIKAHLTYSAVPRQRANGTWWAGFGHTIPDERCGAISGVQAGSWLREDLEALEAEILARDPNANVRQELLDHFSKR